MCPGTLCLPAGNYYEAKEHQWENLSRWEINKVLALNQSGGDSREFQDIVVSCRRNFIHLAKTSLQDFPRYHT